MIVVIELAAQVVGIPAALLLATCSVESDFREISVANDGGSASHGPCQVKVSTARMFGFTGTGSLLEKRWNSAFYAAKYLKHQLDRYDGMICDAVSAYNLGTMSRFPESHYRNRRYVRKFLSRFKEQGGDLSLGQYANCAVGVAG